MMKLRTFARCYSSAETVADSELKPMFKRPAPLAAIHLCLLHNSHIVHKDICFWFFGNSKLKNARQEKVHRKAVHFISVE
jgi:hypothetical protein